MTVSPARSTTSAAPEPGAKTPGIAAAVIDLDGTLLDTAPDLVAAANAMRLDLGQPELPFETIVRFVGKGSENLVHRTMTGRLDGRLPDAELEHAHRVFLARYHETNGRETADYPDVRSGLQQMRVMGLRLACVTNKPAAFTGPLLDATGLADFFEFTYSGDSLPTRKPDAGPMLAACQRFGLPPDRVVAIGDSLNDALAARAAGMPVLAVPYGYNEGRDVRELDVDGIVPTLLAAAAWIAERNGCR